MSGSGGAGRPLRLDADPDQVGRGLGQLVVVVLELLREVLERQAIRRMDGGELTAEQLDDLGQALIEIRHSLERVRTSLGVTQREADDAVARAHRLVEAGAGAVPDRGPMAPARRSARSCADQQSCQKARSAP